MKNNSYIILGILTVFLLTVFSLTISERYLSSKQNNPRETVTNFFKFIEKNDQKSMEQYVTYTPEIYFKRNFKSKQELSSDNKEITSKKTSSNLTESKELKISFEDFQRNAFETKEDLVRAIIPEYIFLHQRYLKRIVKVFENGDQGRVDVILGSRLEGKGEIPTKFWLYKESDGKWRVFKMQSLVINEKFAQ